MPFTVVAAVNNLDLVPCPLVICEGRKLESICTWRQ